MLNIKNLEDIQNKKTLNLIIYGKPKTGKTSAAINSYKPLVIDTERGCEDLDKKFKNKDAEIIQIGNMLNTEEKIQLEEKIWKGDRRTLVIDTIDEFLEFLIEDFKKVNSKNATLVQPRADGITMAGWGRIGEQVRSLARWLRDLPIDVIVIGHSEEVENESKGIIQTKLQLRPKAAKKAFKDLFKGIGYYRNVQNKETKEIKRVIEFGSGDEEIDSGIRTEDIPHLCPPDFVLIKGMYDGIITKKDIIGANLSDLRAKVIAELDETKEAFTNARKEENTRMAKQREEDKEKIKETIEKI